MEKEYGWNKEQLLSELDYLRKTKRKSSYLSTYREMIDLLDRKEISDDKHKSFLRLIINALISYERINYNTNELLHLKDLALQVTEMPKLPQAQLANFRMSNVELARLAK